MVRTSPRIRVMIVDDHHVVRLGLAGILDLSPRFEVVGQSGDVAGAVSQARRCHPDVILMDVRLPDGDGAQACRQIRAEQPRVRVLMLTSYSDDEAVQSAILAGAAGYLLKRCEPERLLDALERVAAGDSLLDPEVTGALLRLVRGSTPDADPVHILSDQERRLLPCIAAGKTNREIAAELGVSWHTVKAQVSSALQKLPLPRRVELARLVTQA